jgi:hypothetical protein
METLITFYIGGGIVFFIFLWLWKSYQNLIAEAKYDKWVARMTLAFPLWPFFASFLLLKKIYNTIKMLLKLSEF